MDAQVRLPFKGKLWNPRPAADPRTPVDGHNESLIEAWFAASMRGYVALSRLQSPGSTPGLFFATQKLSNTYHPFGCDALSLNRWRAPHHGCPPMRAGVRGNPSNGPRPLTPTLTPTLSPVKNGEREQAEYATPLITPLRRL